MQNITNEYSFYDALIATQNMRYSDGTLATQTKIEYGIINDKLFIQTQQSISELYGIEFLTPTSNTLTKVNHPQDLINTPMSYYIVYGGLIQFSPDMENQLVVFKYEGTGAMSIADYRVHTAVDNVGRIIETLHDFIVKARDYMDFIAKVKNVVELNQELETNIANGTALNLDLIDNILLAQLRNSELLASIATALQTKAELDGSISLAQTEKADLIAKTEDAKKEKDELIIATTHADETKDILIAKDAEVKQTLLDVQPDIDMLASSQNFGITITTADWGAVGADGRYSKEVTHGINSKKIIVYGWQGGKNVFFDCEQVTGDELNKIKVYSDTNDTVDLIVAGGYYGGYTSAHTEQIVTDVQNNLSKKIDYRNTFPIEYYGGKANDATFDNYNAYMLAINDSKCATILLSKGNYYFSKIILYNAKNIVGEGMLNTNIIAMDSAEPNFIYLNKGPIAYNLYKGFKITGNKNNPNQNGVYAYGLPQDDTPYHGGFWCNIMQDVYISNFTGVQMHFEGYDPRSSSLVPNQFCTFINVRAFGDSTSKNVLEIISQNGQFMFINCQFDSANTGYYNIYAKGADCIFELLTCQHSDNGIYQEGGTLTIIHPWFEVCKNPITTNNSGTTFGGTITVDGGTFRNCAMGTGTRICKTSSRSLIDFRNVMFMGAMIQTVFENDNDEISSVTTHNLYFALGYTTLFSKTYNLISANASNELKVNTNKMCYVASGNVTTITLGNYTTMLKELYMFALSGAGVVFSGVNFINPQTVAGNKYFKLNLIDGKWLITVLN